MRLRNFSLGGLLTGVGIIVVLVLLIMSLHKIPTGYGGVVYSASGGIQQQVLDDGYKFTSPFAKITELPISTERVNHIRTKDEDQSFNVSTKEGKPVNLDVMYNYHMDAQKLPNIAQKFRMSSNEVIEEGYMKQNLTAVIQSVTSKEGVLDLYGEKRDVIQNSIFKELQAKLEPDGIIIENFSFGEIRPDENSMKAIQAKVDAQQKLEQFAIEKQQAQVLADKAKIEAQGKADAVRIEAQGKADANAKLQLTLTPELIQYETVQAWKQGGSHVPQFIGGGSGSMFNFPIPQMPEQGK